MATDAKKSAGPKVPRLKITELFFSLQGESSYTGRPCAFIRLTGCPLRCTWCDTEYGFKGGEWKTHDELLDWVKSTGTNLVEVTGGEPLAQKGAYDLLHELCEAGYEVLLETAGSHDIGPIDPRVVKIMDIKCPDSGESERNRWENIPLLGERDEVKFVVASRKDYEYAVDIIRRHNLDKRPTPPLLSPVHGVMDLQDLSGWIIEDCLPVRMQIQLHKVIWGADTVGV